MLSDHECGGKWKGPTPFNLLSSGSHDSHQLNFDQTWSLISKACAYAWEIYTIFTLLNALGA